MMTLQESIRRMGDLNMLIGTKLRQASALRSTLSINTPATDGDHVTCTRNVHRMEDRLTAVMDIEREADALIDELVDLKSCLITVINRLPDPKEARLLTERYVEGKGTDQIGAEHGYSRRWVQKQVSNALDHLEQVWTG